MSLLLIISLTLAVIVLSIIIKRCFVLFTVYSKIRHIPGVIQWFHIFPLRIPFLSTYLYLTGSEELENACAKYGDAETQTLRIATSSVPLVFISDPKMLKEFYITKGSMFEKPEHDIIKYFGEDNIVSAINNERWKKHYKICSPAFSPRNLMYVCKVAVNSSELLFKMWNNKIEKSGDLILDVNDYSNLTLDILGKAGFNIDFGIYSDNEEGKIFRQHMENILSPAAILVYIAFPKESILHSLANKLIGVEAATNYCSKFLDKIIEERKKILGSELSSDETSDILSLLVDANTKEESITNNQLKSNTLLLSVAGHETTAKSISWVSYRLSKSPEIQKALWKEVDEVLKGRSPTFEDVSSLPLVNAEETTKNVTLGNFDIPKGSVVHPMLSYVQRREDIWQDASEFKPERFLDPNFRDACQRDFKFAAFSLGNRACLGKNFALLEGCMILTKLVQNFELKLLNDESVDPVGISQLPVAKPTANMKIQITRRK